MADALISIPSSDPSALLKLIKDRIDGKPKELKKIDRWTYDNDGDFAYVVEQYEGKAWVRPVIEKDRLAFTLVWSKDKEPAPDIKSIFIGRFIEMLLAHFGKSQFGAVSVYPIS